MSGFVGDLSPQQEDALRKLRDALSDVEYLRDQDDHYFLRRLRAKKFNVSQSEDMLRKHIEERKKHSLDTILVDYKPNEVLQKYYPGGHMGEDRDGHPVWYESFNYDFRGLHYSVRMEDLMLMSMYRAEYGIKLCADASAKKGRHIGTVTFVLDLEKLSMERHYYWPGIRKVQKILSMYMANYPGYVKHVIFLNAPSCSSFLYNLMRKVLDEYTRSKIILLGSNYKEVLQKYISPDQLPEAYGGTRCEPDPYCSRYINPGGDVPEECYLNRVMEASKNKMERVEIEQASSHRVSKHVNKPQTKLMWEFMSIDRDICYKLYHKTENGKKEDVVRKKRKKSHIIPEIGAHICAAPGEYVLKFYNHSLLHSREVFYSFKIISPEFELSGAIIDETESADPMAIEGALETESTHPMAREGALKTESTDPMAIEDKEPTLPELLQLKIPQHVGANYKMFGTFLLNDVIGSRVNSIERQCLGKPENINITILEEWLTGKGKSCTWQILIETLRDCGLTVLADQVERNKK